MRALFGLNVLVVACDAFQREIKLIISEMGKNWGLPEVTINKITIL